LIVPRRSGKASDHILTEKSQSLNASVHAGGASE
jgi:hypothetical protein